MLNCTFPTSRISSTASENESRDCSACCSAFSAWLAVSALVIGNKHLYVHEKRAASSSCVLLGRNMNKKRRTGLLCSFSPACAYWIHSWYRMHWNYRVLWQSSYRAGWTATVRPPKLRDRLLLGASRNHSSHLLKSPKSQGDCILSWVFTPAHLYFPCVACCPVDVSRCGKPGALPVKRRWLPTVEENFLHLGQWHVQWVKDCSLEEKLLSIHTCLFRRTRLVCIFCKIYVYVLYSPHLIFLSKVYRQLPLLGPGLYNISFRAFCCLQWAPLKIQHLPSSVITSATLLYSRMRWLQD